MKQKSCKTCDSTEGFYVKRKTSGLSLEKYKSDGVYADEQGGMHDGLSYSKPLLRTACVICGGYYGNVKELGISEK